MNYSFLQISKATITAVSVFAVLNSCVKKKIDFDNLADQQLTPEIALPLVNSSFTIKDILSKSDNNGNVSIDPNTNFCTLVYKGELFSVKATDIITLMNQSANTSYSLTPTNAVAINLLTTGSSVSFNFTNSVNYSTNTAGVQLDELTFKSGNLALNISSLIKQDATLTISIPGAIKNGVPLTQVISVLASNGSATAAQVTIDLTGYKIDMTLGGTTTNAFDINYAVQLTKTSNASIAGEKIDITQSFSNQAFSLLKGDIGQQSFTASLDTVGISVFRNVVPGGGSFRINYAVVKFNMENSYGVPLTINNLRLSPYTSGVVYTPTAVPLPASYTPLVINYPTVVGTSAFTNPVPFGGPTETDLNNIINAKPKNFVYTAQTISNPAGPPSAANRNFMTDQSQFKIGMELNIPLDGGAWDFILNDTSEFDLQGNSLENLEAIMLRNYVNNGFPFDIGMNIDFVDNTYAVKQTLSTSAPYADVIPSALIDGNGKVTRSTQKTTDFMLNKAQIDNLKTVKYIIVRVKGNTTNAGIPNVKIYSDYKLDLHMGIKADFNFKLKK